MNDHRSLKELLVTNEGNIPHLYLDTVGRVTVGVGHMILTAEEGKKLPFVVRDSGQAATPEEIANDFSGVEQQPAGMLAASYRAFTRLEMRPSQIDELLDQDIGVMERGLRQVFASYASFPAPAQDALLDMAFNLGVNGLVSKFPKLKAAAAIQDWNTCALQCHRSGISEARNELTRRLFSSAAAPGTAASG